MKNSVLSGVVKFVALSIPTLLLSLAAAEWTVRQKYPEHGIPVREHRMLTEFDPLLGWRKIPNLRGTHEQDEYKIVETFNSRGLRGPDYAYEKKPGVYRILVLGDSYCEGYTVEFPELVTEVMGKMWRVQLKQPVEIINAGTGGYSTDQELLFFQLEGQQYQPDLTIVLFYSNDLPMNVSSDYKWKGRGEKPMFELVDDELVLTHLPTAKKDIAPEAGGPGHERKFVLRDPDTWYLPRLVKHAIQTYRPPEESIEELLPTSPEEKADSPVAPQTAYKAGAAQREEWRMTEALMKQLQQECRVANSKLVLFYIPEKREIYGKGTSITTTPSTHQNNLGVLASHLDIPLIPTVDAFRARAKELHANPKLSGNAQRLYWIKDSHWTAEGHHLAGQIIAKYLADHCAEYEICDRPK